MSSEGEEGVKADIWMPVYIGDYLRDTQDLDGCEHGAYLLLLMHYWQRQGSIGSDVDRLARVARSDRAVVEYVLERFFEPGEGGFKNKRADEEMEKANSRRESAIENGKKGGRPPKNPEKTHRFSVGKPTQNPEGNPQKSSSQSQSPSQSYSKSGGERPPKGKPEMIKDSAYGLPVGKTQYNRLVTEYGQKRINDYIQRIVNWERNRSGARTKDYAARAENWLKRDNIPKQELPKSTRPSYLEDTDER